MNKGSVLVVFISGILTGLFSVLSMYENGGAFLLPGLMCFILGIYLYSKEEHYHQDRI